MLDTLITPTFKVVQTIATQNSFYNYRARPVSGHACLLPTLSTVGQLHYRTLEIEKNLALRKHKGNYEAQPTLSPSVKGELSCWIENVDKDFNPISHGNPVLELRTDASKKGWGVYLDGDTIQACGPSRKASCTSIS